MDPVERAVRQEFGPDIHFKKKIEGIYYFSFIETFRFRPYSSHLMLFPDVKTAMANHRVHLFCTLVPNRSISILGVGITHGDYGQDDLYWIL